MPKVLTILAKLADGSQVVLSPTPKAGEFQLDPAVSLAIEVATETPSGAILVRAGDDAAAILRAAKPYDSVLFQRGDRWPIQIALSNSDLRIGCFGDPTKPRPIIGGLYLTAPVSNVIIEDLDLQPICPKPEDRIMGLRLIAKTCRDITLRRVRIAGFEDNVALHHKDTNAPVNQWHTNILFDRCHFLDGKDVGKPEDFRGQGIFAFNVSGLVFKDCLFDQNGRGDKDTVYRHGAYVGVACSNVVFSGCIATRNANIGIMTRAPGSIQDRNFYADNGICALLNGASGVLTDCVGVRGHWTTQPDGAKGGRNGFDLHIGSGRVANNLLLGPASPKIPKGYYQHPIGFSISPRKKVQGWEFDGPTKPKTDNNVEKVDRTIDATQEILAARATAEADFDIGPIREALFAKARAAAK